ncbi:MULTISPECIES: conserved phage C-terminal domain-containing protein [Bacillaceae]|uniref:Conserved phage C-terminal domain-containing protein n=1 Tax=Evansella alkalicola TaxID=745819 RepID=A0ABS6JRU6_9BACI|nr:MULTISPECIES: conserved phage C-terminal domain-containing protein [Bacillaceae]MBU9720967.1 conserved phage C-terminal domain-containing protein [Bacillus alkalicola]
MLKRAVVKEELVALTGDYRLALPLNQMIYWSERVNDYHTFIKEEKGRWQDINSPTDHGWIYKKGEQLSEETLMNCDARTMRTYLRKLVAGGWLQERDNPIHNRDNTKQYRVNLVKIHHDLGKLGFELAGYKVNLTQFFSKPEPHSKPLIDEGENGIVGKNQFANAETKHTSFPKEVGKNVNSTDKLVALTDNMVGVSDKTVGTIPENITNITTEKKEDIDEINVIISYLNKRTFKNFLPTSKTTQDLIRSRWKEGYRRHDFFTVIDRKAADWLFDDYMNKYLRPSTLFGDNFENYLNESKRPAKTSFDAYIAGLGDGGGQG